MSVDPGTLAADQRAAIEATMEGGIVGFVQRLRKEHVPRFTQTEHVSDRYPNGVVYAGCQCDEMLCGHRDLLLVHIDDLRSAYAGKVEDLARETVRTSEQAAVLSPLHDAWLKAKPPCPTCGGTHRVDDPDRTSNGNVVELDCPDCSDGVLPFDKWTAGLAEATALAPVSALVALWTAVHGPDWAGDGSYPHTDDFLARLRQIGGAR